MGGFKNAEIQKAFSSNLFDIIVEKILLCSKIMEEECSASARLVENHEDKIKNRLVTGYLQKDEVRLKVGLDKAHLRFIVEAPENYDSSKDVYIGRLDIKVVNENWFLNENDYYTIECKRIDGTQGLNKDFVVEGIARFVLEPVKYSSFHDKNIMFGFIVKKIDIADNALKIDEIQRSNLSGIIEQCFCKKNNQSNEDHTYSSRYLVKGRILELQHLFFDFSSIIKVK